MNENNNLLTIIKQVSQKATKIGALQPIKTEYEQIISNEIPFLVRVIINLARKDEETKHKKQELSAKNKSFNPFLPYDRNLFVKDISPTHLCLLNKFNVVDHHLLIVTKAYENQETLINQEDFFALSICMNQIDGLAFYNSGKNAGASVQHKHLQLVPFPLSPFCDTIPLDKILLNFVDEKSFFQIPQFPFKHGFINIKDEVSNPDQFAKKLNENYLQLLEILDIKINNNIPSQGYNLLLTRQWMLIVPRREECYQEISINALGFAGLLLVRNHLQLDLLKKIQPINLLTQITEKK
jgi:sulfate adenylyltransferase (ADP) / ATP adenylyltransferase